MGATRSRSGGILRGAGEEIIVLGSENSTSRRPRYRDPVGPPSTALNSGKAPEEVSPENDPTVSLFGITISNVTMSQAISRIERAVRNPGRCHTFGFVNAHSLNISHHDERFRSVLGCMERVFGDGVGVRIAARVSGTPLKANVNGTDMLPELCALCAEKGYRLYLLGAKPGVAARMRARLEEVYPRLRIVGCRHGYFDRERESPGVIHDINRSRADIVLVAFGVPEQEKWIVSRAAKLTCPVCIGVGGLFDFYSGDIPRAPIWMRRHGLEWLFRFMMEPARLWRRYLFGNPFFLYRVARDRVGRRRRLA